MKLTLSTVFRVLSILFLLPVLLRCVDLMGIISQPPDHIHGERLTSYLVGLFLPSIVCFIISAKLRQSLPAAISTENQRNIVVLTPSAAALVRSVFTDRGYSSETGLRIVLRDDCTPAFDVRYDVLSDDGHDWIGESAGIAVLVEKAIADRLYGLTIDARDGQFVYCVDKNLT